MKWRLHIPSIGWTARILVIPGTVTLLAVAQLSAWHPQDAPWSRNVAISEPQAVPGRPDVAVDIAGRAYVVWYDARADGSRGIYVASRPAGGAWKPAILIPGSDAGNAGSPAIAAGGAGEVYVAWSRGFPETRADILFAWSTAGGVTWEGPVQVNTDSQDIAGQPDVAVDGEGNVHVVWADLSSFGDRHSRDIKWSMRPSGLTTWTEPVVVHQDVEVFTEQARPALTADGAGNVYAIWEDARHGPGDRHAIYAARLPAGSMEWAPSRRVDHRPGEANLRPDLAVAPDGTIYAVWDGGAAGEVYSALLRPEAQTWEGPTRISGEGGMENGKWKGERGDWAGAGGAPRVAVDGRGIVYAVWQDSRDDDLDIYAAVRLPGAPGWGWNMRVNDDAGLATQEMPAIAASRAGWVVAVWDDQRGVTSPAVYAAEFGIMLHSVRLPVLAR